MYNCTYKRYDVAFFAKENISSPPVPYPVSKKRIWKASEIVPVYRYRYSTVLYRSLRKSVGFPM